MIMIICYEQLNSLVYTRNMRVQSTNTVCTNTKYKNKIQKFIMCSHAMYGICILTYSFLYF